MIARRRCAHCRKPLPTNADPRRRYCSTTCVARAYRARKSAAQKQALTATIFDGKAEAFLSGEDGRQRRLLAWQHCPSCGAIVWAGVRRRVDAVYCSDACRMRAARARAKSRELDDQP